MKYLSKRFTGKYGFFKFIFLLLLMFLGPVPASYSILIRGVDKSVLYIMTGVYLLVAFLFFLIFYRRFKFSGGFSKNLMVLVVSIFAIYGLSFLLDLIFGSNLTNPQNQETIESMLRLNFSPALIAYIVFLGPLVEEYTFREYLPGVFRKIFKRRDQDIKDIIALIMANVLFSLAHMPTDIYSFLVYFSIGFVLVLVRFFTNNLKLSALVHIFWNLLSTLILYFTL
ncbi:CPBP family intramembrane glutamic endopeptidase [Anaerococcus hydrogenalis]|uniref:CPBP family intramembrane glutamic endopeptidase n=1 Tax=Anaerococcus hydrogenalis TaxID=33029 RepID=UPI001DA39A84|nr:type II CAAX endopeptidase family protein [Anaerococcus hydrogenalis]MBS5989447.1 CPBP family intramembrane metalloprotease [Anaerococcus hydrogenalis]